MTAPPPRIVLRHYEVVAEIGRGGMGVVYEGRDRRDGSKVAIKALHPHLAAMDQGFGERFEREAHIAALLRSPYTVHLLDFGVDAGQYFLVMEFVEGESLATTLERGPLEPASALQIAAEIARALEEAAARGVVHRDIKPDNVLIEQDGRVKVTDFGIARQAGSGGLTQIGAFVGTAAYAAPEQVEGEADARSDIYALGATLYCMLAGSPPYRGRTAMEVLVQHRTVSLPMGPLSHLPDSVQNIVRRCLEKNPLDRYSSPGELAAALERARVSMLRMQTQPPPMAPGAAAAGYVRATPAVLAPESLPGPRPTEVAPPGSPATEVAGTGNGTEVAAGRPATVVAPQTPHEPPRITPAATVVAPPPISTSPGAPPPSAGAAVPRRRRPNLALAGLGIAITAAAIFGIVFVLTKGDGTSPPTSPSPTTAGAGAISATAGPASTATPVPPTVFPPASAKFSILSAGVQARVVDSSKGSDGLCPLAVWTEPSETASATNQAVVRLCTGDIVTVGSDPSRVAEGATWWHVTANGGAATGWTKEGTTDGAHRYLALNNLQFAAPETVVDAASTYTAVIMTPLGNIDVELYADQSPRTVNNFVFLAEKGYYSGTTFYHLVKDLFIEGGDPTGTGTGDPGYQLAVEGNTVRNVRGAIAMSAVVGQFGGKFFVYTQKPKTSLDFDGTELAKVYPFGMVTSGLDVLDRIASTETDGANMALQPVTISNVVIEQRPR